MKGSWSKHQAIVTTLENRLTTEGLKPTTNLEYSCRGLCGEFDVLVVTNNHCRYYEVKCHYNPRNLKKAIEQFRRANQAYPKANWQYVLVTPERIRLLHNSDIWAETIKY